MSTVFEPFREPIEFQGYDLPPLGEAYRIDGVAPKPSMREQAQLGGGLACCDYILVDGDEFTIIEDTDLELTRNSIEGEYDHLKGDVEQRTQFVRDRIRNENCLKVYGTLLILCRLQAWPTRCKFWLVMTGSRAGWAKSARHLNLDGALEAAIGAALQRHPGTLSPIEGALRSAKLVDEVEVMTVPEFIAARGGGQSPETADGEG